MESRFECLSVKVTDTRIGRIFRRDFFHLTHVIASIILKPENTMQNMKIQRKRIRLEKYEYSKMGSYFITICTAGNRCSFGKIIDGHMSFEPIGNIVENVWSRIPARFSGISLGDFVTMPNHIHGIIMLDGQLNYVTSTRKREAAKGQEREATEGLPYKCFGSIDNWGGTKAAPSIPQIVHWYKTWTTNEYFRYMKVHFPGQDYSKLWHRSYYDHIIRNQEDYGRISNYIQNNPMKWQEDRFIWPENR
jgi:REP element-mobilizing transposase RayT